MDTLFVLNKPIKNFKLKSKFINPRKKRVHQKPYTCVTFAPNTTAEKPFPNKISFVRLYNELCTNKIPKSKFCLDVTRNPVQNLSRESVATQYHSGGDMKVYEHNYPLPLRTDSLATAEVMLEMYYGTYH